MRRKKRPLLLFILGLLFLVGLISLIFFFDPTYQFRIYNLEFRITILFFIFLFLAVSSLFSYLFKNIRRGVFIGLFTASYLIFRLNNLNQIFFLTVLLAIFITFELIFTRQK